MATASRLVCPRCHTPFPDVARFCARCGADVRAETLAGHRRRGVFAIHPGEPVWSMNLISTLMPFAAGSTLQTFRFALVVALAVPIIAAAFGFLPFAFAAAAVAVPFVFLLYLRDVNQWDEDPVPVLVGAVVLAGLLALGFTLLWRNVLTHGPVALIPNSNGFSVDVTVLLVIGLLVPVVSEVLKELGPLWLASRPRFDDLLDGVTFGVAAGAAYAAVETLVLNSGLLFSSPQRIHSPNAAVWISIIVVSGLIKPVIYGAASGLAVAGWSGSGKGYRGLGGPYLRRLAEAILANVVFQVILYLTGRLGGVVGITLGLAFTLALAGLLVLRLRYVLHDAVLEEALEATNQGEAGIAASNGIGFCGHCELPLLDGASFCVACGMSVRACSKLTRQANSAPSDRTGAGPKAFPAPALAAWGAAATPPRSTRHPTRTMVTATLALVALMGGAFAAINVATRPSSQHSRIPGVVASSYEIGGSGPHTISFTSQTAHGRGPDSTVLLDHGVAVTVPGGWNNADEGDFKINGTKVGNYVHLQTDGAVVEVSSYQPPPGVTAATLLSSYAQGVLSNEVQNLTPGMSSGPQLSGNEADSFDQQFSATAAGNQGSLQLDGDLRAIITKGGRAVIFVIMNAAGQFNQYKADMTTMFQSVIQSLPN
jgi:protease prsW family protein